MGADRRELPVLAGTRGGVPARPVLLLRVAVVLFGGGAAEPDKRGAQGDSPGDRHLREGGLPANAPCRCRLTWGLLQPKRHDVTISRSTDC